MKKQQYAYIWIHCGFTPNHFISPILCIRLNSFKTSLIDFFFLILKGCTDLNLLCIFSHPNRPKGYIQA